MSVFLDCWKPTLNNITDILKETKGARTNGWSKNLKRKGGSSLTL